MKGVTEWMRGSVSSGHEWIRLPLGPDVLGAVLHNIIAKRASPIVRVGPLPIEPSPDNEGALVECLQDLGSTSDLLRQARRRVVELENTVSRQEEFLAMLGHELRNPLASILNGTHLLIHHKQAPASQKVQAMIERQVQQMTRLVDDLLDVSRITHGCLRLQCERIDLREVLSNAVQTLESDIGQRNHRLTVSLPDTPMWLQADPGRLEQVFVNLLANAAKYTDTGGELRVGGSMQDDQAVVRVCDSGIGIAPEVLPRLFDLFWQADASVSRARSGLGIGLALVRNLVESHGGIVTAESAGLGLGSEFTVYLPMES